MRQLIWLCLPFLIASCTRRENSDSTARAGSSSQPAVPAPASHTPPSGGSAPLGSVDSTDLVVARLRLGMSMDTATALLGAPKKVTDIEDPRGAGVPFKEWDYPDLLLLWEGGFGLMGMRLTGPRLATARGLRVGDSDARVIALYGEPATRYESDWYYPSVEEGNPNQGMTVTVVGKRVTGIYVGITVD